MLKEGRRKVPRVDIPRDGAALIGTTIAAKAQECDVTEYVFIEGEPSGGYLIIGVTNGFVRRSESHIRPVVGGWQAT